MSISKRLRFEVFRRDNFTCQYCGAYAPNVVLQIDHIHPIARGGEDRICNLITACHECNSGKSDTLLGDDSFFCIKAMGLEEGNEDLRHAVYIRTILRIKFNEFYQAENWLRVILDASEEGVSLHLIQEFAERANDIGDFMLDLHTETSMIIGWREYHEDLCEEDRQEAEEEARYAAAQTLQSL